MGILNTLLGGDGQQTATGQHLAQQASSQAIWTTGTTNPHLQQIPINTTGALHPSTWAPSTPLTEQIDELRYILKRTVENYDELVTQYKALQDITKAEENK
jgi:hypothetical protein